VVFAGHALREELSRWYAAADAFVLPSRSEPWGMVLNEAAAAGLPLVATEAAGAAYDLIEPGVNGYLVPPDDVGALAGALRRVEADAAWRASAGRRSRELVQAFTPEAWATALARLTFDLLRRRST
jgi:glycosyltransferase involved in cell wall biosynthesis